MKRSTLLTLMALSLTACNEAGQSTGFEEADARHVEVLEAEIAAMEPASAEAPPTPAVEPEEEAPAVVPDTPFENSPGSTMRHRKVGSAGSCDVYEVEVAGRSYILTQNTYQSAHTPVCQITPR